MGYPGRQNIYAATIRRMVLQALDEQEQKFRQEHDTDTDEQLLTYLRSCAFRLNHSPWPDEITGGRTIEERFGSWSRALSLAKLPPPWKPDQPVSFARVQEETVRQKEIYRRRKAEKKMRAQKRLTEQAARKKH